MITQTLNTNTPITSKSTPIAYDLLIVLAGIALLALSAQLYIPLKPVPLTFQTATVLLLAMLFGARRGTAVVIGYLLFGISGMPVFHGFQSGIDIVATSGYLLGFAPAAWVTGYLSQKGYVATTLRAFFTALAGCTIIFASGLLALTHLMGFQQAVAVGLMPFIMTEPLKLVAVALIVPHFK